MKLHGIRRAWVLVAAAGCWAAGVAVAAPVTVGIAEAAFTLGPGYGSGAGQLGVTFAPAVGSGTLWTQLAAGQAVSIELGSFTLAEENHSIDNDEVDGLGLSAWLRLTGAIDSTLHLDATVKVDKGPLRDNSTGNRGGIDGKWDLQLIWQPLELAFGDGGLLGLTLTELKLTDQGHTAPQFAILSLLSAPQPAAAPAAAIPEPGSLALAGLGLCMAAVSRRRRTAQR